MHALVAGCCDPFNDKALRASRGVPLHFSVGHGSWEQLQAVIDHHRLVCLAAHASVSGIVSALPCLGLMALQNCCWNEDGNAYDKAHLVYQAQRSRLIIVSKAF